MLISEENIKEFITPYGALRYLDYVGDKSPILFIHGLGCCGSIDYPPIANHSKLIQHRCIVVDLLGSGLSDKPRNFEYTLVNQAQLLATFVNEIKLDKLTVYGHSMGGTIAILLTELIVEKVNAIILSEANLDRGGGTFSKRLSNSTLNDFCNHDFNEIVKSCMESDDNNDVQWSTSLAKTLPKAVYEEAIALVKGQDISWRDTFYGFSMKKSFFFGKKSLPDNDFDILKMNNINVQIISDSGHSMAWENPDDLAIKIANSLV